MPRAGVVRSDKRFAQEDTFCSWQGGSCNFTGPGGDAAAAGPGGPRPEAADGGPAHPGGCRRVGALWIRGLVPWLRAHERAQGPCCLAVWQNPAAGCMACPLRVKARRSLASCLGLFLGTCRSAPLGASCWRRTPHSSEFLGTGHADTSAGAPIIRDTWSYGALWSWLCRKPT